VADSGRMEMTPDKKYLNLHLYSGEQFENLKTQSMAQKNVPYRRESFREKHSLIEFDANFNQMDASVLSNQAAAKGMKELGHSIDSMNARFDSIGRGYYTDSRRITYKKVELTSADSTRLEQNQARSINVDSLFNVQSHKKREQLIQSAMSRVQSQSSDLSMKSFITSDGDKNIRRHQKFWWEKITLSLACIIFFFIGAPLGAIIRKGGLGMPVIISVVLFIFYYIIENTGSKMAREGELQMWFGVWISTMVLVPLGAWLTYKANGDSVVFNIDAYKAFFMKLLGMRNKRHVFKKEVIIEDPNYPEVYNRLDALSQQCETYATKERFDRAPNYIRIFTRNEDDTVIQQISDELESLVEILNNSTDTQLVNALNEYPILSVNAHKSPSSHRWLNVTCGLVVPVGLLFYVRIWMFGRRLDKDLRKIEETNKIIMARIKEL